jgi:hypothetical protein
MALDLTTYVGLQDTVAKYLNRRDLTDFIPAFIAQAHAKFNRELRVRDMHVRATGTSSDEYIAVPGDFLAPYSLELATTPGVWAPPLKFISEQDAVQLRADGASGSVGFYTMFGSEFELVPTPTEATNFKLKYFASIPALSGTLAANWLLLKSPDLYVVGACLEAAVFLKNDERLQTWATIRQQIIDNITLESERALKPQSALSARTRSFG